MNMTGTHNLSPPGQDECGVESDFFGVIYRSSHLRERPLRRTLWQRVNDALIAWGRWLDGRTEQRVDDDHDGAR
jgi:hypothetical protein